MNNTSKEEQKEVINDSMDFEQPIAPDFDADDIDIFAELGAPLLTQSTTPSPPQNILLEDDEPMSVDPQLVAELLQVLAQHSIRQHSDEGINVLPAVSYTHLTLPTISSV